MLRGVLACRLVCLAFNEATVPFYRIFWSLVERELLGEMLAVFRVHVFLGGEERIASRLALTRGRVRRRGRGGSGEGRGEGQC